MANFDVRLSRLEKKVNFIMSSIRMKGAVGSGLLKVDGSPDMRLIEGSLEEFYNLAKLADQVLVEDQPDSTSAVASAASLETSTNG